ncbi:MAG: 16S rRNA (cytosine(967)-C(5))-methyltransferase RsmB, partial [Acidiferrobacter sp.]
DTLTRLQRISDIQILTLDLTTTEVPGSFRRILLDAPCSATGVIRRHPDIKLHRRAEDLDTLRCTQALLLNRLWQNLAPGGTMVYATCSVLPEENDEQVADFLRRTEDASETAFSFPVGRCRQHGWQFLPGESDMDGFYYARFIKRG